MDDRGRLAQPLKGAARWRLRLADHAAARAAPPSDGKATRSRPRIARIIERWSSLLDSKWPRGVGVAATAVIIVASLAYGVVKGDHVPSIIGGIKGARDGIAGLTGFRVVSIALAGNHHLSREEVLAAAGVTGTTSLLFLDVDQTRERLKLYPGELQIGVKEREAFALWQKDGHVSVIADDGTVLEPYVAPRLIQLPLVVGEGAQTKAKEF